MTTYRPLVIVSGLVSALPAGDSFSAGSASSSQLIGTSGLVGSGSVNGAVRLDVQPAVASSGVIFTDSALGCDGAAFATATTAQASGTAALSLSSTAQASGNAAISLALTAQASGNAALAGAAGTSTNGPTATFTAGVTFSAGVVPAGLNNANLIEPIRVATTPTVSQSVTTFPSGNTPMGSTCTYHSAQNRTVNVFAFPGTYYPAANVCQVVSGSGTWTTPVILESVGVGTAQVVSTYEPTSQRILVTYASGGTSLRGIVLSLTGSTITAFSQGAFLSGAYIYYVDQASNSAGSNIVLAYTDNTTLSARIVTISGNTATYGTAVVVRSSNNPYPVRLAVLTSTKFFIMYSTTVGILANVCTTAGTTITVNSTYTLFSYPAQGPDYFGLAYHVSGDYLLAAFYINTDTYPVPFEYNCLYITVSGTVISVVNYTNLGSYGNFSSFAYLTYSSNLNRILLIDCYYNRVAQFYLYGTVPYLSNVQGGAGYTYRCIQPAYDSTSNTYITAGDNLTSTNTGNGIVTSISGNYSILPTRNGFNNFIGLVNTAAGVPSGTSTTVTLPGGYVRRNATTFSSNQKIYLGDASVQYSDTYNLLPNNLPGWNSDLPWTNIGYSATASGILVLKSI